MTALFVILNVVAVFSQPPSRSSGGFDGTLYPLMPDQPPATPTDPSLPMSTPALVPTGAALPMTPGMTPPTASAGAPQPTTPTSEMQTPAGTTPAGATSLPTTPSSAGVALPTAPPMTPPTLPAIPAPGPAAPNLCLPRLGISTLVTRLAPTLVCATLSTPLSSLATATAPISDELSAVAATGSFTNASSATLTVSSLGAQSAARPFISDGRVFTVHLAVITVMAGVVTSIDFDEGCNLCDMSDCTSIGTTSACSTTAGDCLPLPSGSGNTCDLTLFLAWTGTDAAGTPFESASLAFSRLGSWPLYSTGTAAVARNVLLAL